MITRNGALRRTPLVELLIVAGTLAGIAACTVVALGALADRQPMLALVAALAVPLGFAMLAWPDSATLLVVFVLYTNAAVVAVQFHGLPYAVGAAVPLILLVPLAHYVILRNETVIINRLMPLVALFVLVQIVGTVFAKRPAETVAALVVSIVEGLGLYLIVTNVVRTPEMLRRVVWVLLAAGALMGGLSCYQQLTRTYGNDYGGFAQTGDADLETAKLEAQAKLPRVAGPIGEKNRYAQVMLMLVPLGMFRVSSERSPVLRLLAAAATILAALGSALTLSRGAAVGLALMLLVMACMGYIRLYQLGAVALGALLVLAAIPQYAARLASLASLWTVLSGEAGPRAPDGAIEGRATEMLAAARVFADHPVFGVGPGMFKYYSREYGEEGGMRRLEGTREAHCLYLGIAANHGAVGLAVFLAMLFVALRDLARARRRWMRSRPESAATATAFMLALVTYMTTGIFLHFTYVRYFWLMLALAAIAGYAADLGEGSAEPEPPPRGDGRARLPRPAGMVCP